MKNRFFSFLKLLLAGSFIISLFTITSCIQPYEEDDVSGEYSILGTWESNAGEKYEITSQAYNNYSHYDSTWNYHNDQWFLYYSTENLFVKKLSNSSGYLYAKFNDSEHIGSGANVGEWYAFYYRDLTSNSVKICQAYKDGGKLACASLEQAVSEFTLENGYYPYSVFSECIKTANASGEIPLLVNDDSTSPAGSVIATSYLRNFAGTYYLSNSTTLNVGAKINLYKDTNHYWNANVVNPIYDETTETYSFLLAHSSQKDASGSIDPGITGNEPFITQQGLFWSRMTLTAKPGSQWEIKWSSVWTDSMTDAASLSLDQSDEFTGPTTSKIKYTYKFYFGNPVKEDGWYTVNKESLIYETEFETWLPTDKTWKEIFDEYEIASKISLPEGISADYWWYSTKSITGIEESYVYKLTDNYKPSLTEYEFYLATKEKPAKQTYLREGVYYIGETGVLELSQNKISYKGKNYTLVDSCIWSCWDDDPNLPKEVAYLVTDSVEKKYLLYIYYYINKPNATNNSTNNYVKARISTSPVTYSECPVTRTITGLDSMSKSLVVQKEDFWYEYISGSENLCLIVNTDNSVIIKVGTDTFTSTFSQKGSNESLSMPAGEERIDMEVKEYLWLSDCSTPGSTSYPILQTFYELQLVDIEYMGWSLSVTKATSEYDEENDEYYYTYSILGNYFLTTEQAQSLLSHF